MPNIKISDLPSAILPLDSDQSFFEVQTVEAGEEVSRKVTATDIAIDLPDGTVVGSIIRLDVAPDTYINSDQVVADGTNVILRDSLHASPNQPSLQTAIQGPFFAGRRTIATTAETAVDGRVTMTDLLNGVQTWDLGHQQTTAAGVLLMRNHIETGLISLRASSSGGTFGDRTLFEGDPDGNSQIFHGASDAPIARSTTVGAGGLEVDNQATGPGFERVLTLVDLFGGALNDLSDVTLTAPSTGSVLYKSAGDWLDTNAVDIDPTAAVQLRNNGVVRILTTANGATINASGALGLVTLFATASVASFYSQYNGTNGGVAIKNQNPGARLVQISTGGGEEDVWMEMTRNGAVALNNNGNLRFRTDANEGIAVIATTDIRPKVVFRDAADANDVGIVGFPNSNGMTLRNLNIGGRINLQFTDVGPTTTNAFQGDPGDEIRLYFDNVNVARTITAATGGLEANNTLTGAGFERVLTASDLVTITGTVNEIVVAAGVVGIADDAIFPGNGAIEVPTGTTGEEPASENGRIRYDNTTSKMRVVEDESWIDMITDTLAELTDVTLTTPVTGGVLYKSAGNWLDTPAILIDPVADIKLHQNTVEVARTLTAAAGGFEVENSLTGVGFRRVLTEADALTDVLLSDTSIPTTSFVTVLAARCEASRQYSITGFIMLDVPLATDDSIWRWDIPAGATGEIQFDGIDQAGATTKRTPEGGSFTSNDDGTVVPTSYALTGYLIIAGTPGDVIIEISKLVDAGGDALALQGSWIKIVPMQEA